MLANCILTYSPSTWSTHLPANCISTYSPSTWQTQISRRVNQDILVVSVCLCLSVCVCVLLLYNLFISTVGSPVHVVRSSYRSCCCRYCYRFDVIVWAVVVLIGVFTSICWYQFIDTVVAISLATISSDQLAP